MPKVRSTYVCQNCGAIAPRWQGKCNDCGEWHTIVEEAVIQEGRHARAAIKPGSEPLPLTDRAHPPPPRLSSGIGECDRVLGGGIVEGSLTLIGGDPGIGKSTLMLAVSHFLARTHGPVLYVSGEESFEQTRLRAQRMGALHDTLFLLTETSVEAIRKHIGHGDYRFIVVDSIQSVYSSHVESVPGSVSQVRECANEFLRVSKGEGIAVFLVGHVTKDGAIAGPRLLEHLVDTVLYFEGDGKQALRILRGVKNRFGSTNEIGVFEMTDGGLKEVANPSALFLHERPEGISGSVVIPSVEGTRPLLVEVQALVTESHLGSPRRTVAGVNPNRLALLLAVLEKRVGLHLAGADVYINVAGGVRLEEPATDLAVALALASSLRDRPLPPHVAVFGEIGLAGEVRAVDRARGRVAEASKFGFTQCMLPAGCMSDLDAGGVEMIPVGNVAEAVAWAMEC